jgi:hypothetical protein
MKDRIMLVTAVCGLPRGEQRAFSDAREMGSHKVASSDASGNVAGCKKKA